MHQLFSPILVLRSVTYKSPSLNPFTPFVPPTGFEPILNILEGCGISIYAMEAIKIVRPNFSPLRSKGAVTSSPRPLWVITPRWMTGAPLSFIILFTNLCVKGFRQCPRRLLHIITFSLFLSEWRESNPHPLIGSQE